MTSINFFRLCDLDDVTGYQNYGALKHLKALFDNPFVIAFTSDCALRKVWLDKDNLDWNSK